MPCAAAPSGNLSVTNGDRIGLMSRRITMGPVVNQNQGVINLLLKRGPEEPELNFHETRCDRDLFPPAILRSLRGVETEHGVFQGGENKMNPVAQKILEAGGTVLSEPLLNADGEINQKCANQLLDALERPERRSLAIWRAVRKGEKPK